ncbi:MAG: hypothetical protein C0P74_004240 [Gammaproteobacteria bacterium]|nr:hypothetical protein [Gammaproteobacteria bacterium]
MWRKARITVLLLILVFVALHTYFERVYSTDWDTPLRVAIYPINGDGSVVAERFIADLDPDDLHTLEAFFEREARRYELALERPVRMLLGRRIQALPPMLAEKSGALGTILWSLRMRVWAWRHGDRPHGFPPDVKLFVLFFDPAHSSKLPHSVGLQKGLLGIVYAFADHRMMGSNDVVIAHELLHTLGATDKYDPETNLPLHPHGYAEPGREPLYPQRDAELMGGRIPLSEHEAGIPESLERVRIGAKTAEEIGWVAR